MKINWKVRKENILFLAQIALAVMTPILAYFGMNLEDLTTWATVGNLFVQAIQNPFVVLTVAVSVFNAVTDPTTKGVSDSDRAMTYTKPN